MSRAKSAEGKATITILLDTEAEDKLAMVQKISARPCFGWKPCRTPELMTKIDAFRIPSALKKRLKMEVTDTQDGTDA